MMKRDNVYSQIQPALSLASDKIATTGFNEVFIYLGRTCSFDMYNTVPKQLLENKLSDLLKVTNHLKVKAQTKGKILSQYIHSQVLFEIKHYDFPLTWVEQSLDSISVRYICDWLEMPISSCMKETLTLPKSKCSRELAHSNTLHRKC